MRLCVEARQFAEFRDSFPSEGTQGTLKRLWQKHDMGSDSGREEVQLVRRPVVTRRLKPQKVVYLPLLGLGKVRIPPPTTSGASGSVGTNPPALCPAEAHQGDQSRRAGAAAGQRIFTLGTHQRAKTQSSGTGQRTHPSAAFRNQKGAG